MNKGEYNHYHSYQDQKDVFNERLSRLSAEILNDLWSDCSSIQEALTESLAESDDYSAIIKYCHNNNSTSLLGEITMELIGVYLTKLADELAEERE